MADGIVGDDGVNMLTPHLNLKILALKSKARSLLILMTTTN